MELIPLSFLAGILTVLSPCVFTLIPVILGGSLRTTNWKKPVMMILSLEIFILIFSTLIKATTLLINIPDSLIHFISGLILLLVGVFTLYPELWSGLIEKVKFQNRSQNLLQNTGVKNDFGSYILSGAALGLVFSSCSPTYALIISTILPRNFLEGFINLIAYVSGLGLILFLISVLGQRLISRLKWAANPKGIFRYLVGILLIVIGTLIIIGADKVIEANLLKQSWFLNITNFEISKIK